MEDGNKKVVWTEDKKEKVLNLVQVYIEKHQAWSGEMIQQDDDASIEATDLAADIADIVDLFDER